MNVSKEVVLNYFIVGAVIGDGPVTEICTPPEEMTESKPIVGFK